VIYRNLAAAPLAHLSGAHLAVRQGALPEASLSDDLAAGATALHDFLAANIIVIGAPMYNFSIPTQLKAWIDRIAVAGKMFSDGPEGVKGLARGKRMITALSRGNFYGAGAPAAACEHAESYLSGVFGFIGVTDIKVIVAEGTNTGPEHREKAVASALQAATEMRAA
jgi:FMN-dependent NADH-azoreductase